MPGLLRGMARTAVIAGTATAVSNNVSRRQAARWSDQQDQTAETAESTSIIDENEAQIQQLQQLGQLRDQGILTEKEFAAKKQQILGF
jgi:hypothetical protein